MKSRSSMRSTITPIVLGAVSVPLSVALLVGWTVLLADRLAVSDSVGLSVSLLVLGVISFTFIVVVLILMSVYLVREILEVRRQDGFIDSVTHELKSPLASLRMGLETLHREGLDDARRESLRLMMLDDVERLASFIDDILQASRLASREVEGTSMSEVSLREMVAPIARAARGKHKLPDDALRLEIPDSLEVISDQAALRLVVRNLIDNAVKYSEEGKVDVLVSAERKAGGEVILRVRDRGIGLDPKHRRKVFHRFFRVESAEVRRRKGTGLGLFVVSALVRNLGGRIRAHSPGLGQGTTMEISLPPVDGAVTSARGEPEMLG